MQDMNDLINMFQENMEYKTATGKTLGVKVTINGVMDITVIAIDKKAVNRDDPESVSDDDMKFLNNLFHEAYRVAYDQIKDTYKQTIGGDMVKLEQAIKGNKLEFKNVVGKTHNGMIEIHFNQYMQIHDIKIENEAMNRQQPQLVKEDDKVALADLFKQAFNNAYLEMQQHFWGIFSKYNSPQE